MKEEILDIVQKSKAKIRSIESTIKTIRGQEENIHKNYLEVNCEIDIFIGKQIELLEQKRQSMKDDLRKSVSAQKENLDAQMESFRTSLDCLKSSVEFTEEALTRGSEVEILSTKNEMVKQLTELNSATFDFNPRGQICYRLEIDSSVINFAALEKVVIIREHDGEFKLFRKIVKPGMQISFSEDLRSARSSRETFCLCPKSNHISSTLNQASKVQVTIIAPGSKKVQVPVTNDPDGSFSFSYKPFELGNYKIEVRRNGRFDHVSSFTWEVEKSTWYERLSESK